MKDGIVTFKEIKDYKLSHAPTGGYSDEELKQMDQQIHFALEYLGGSKDALTQADNYQHELYKF